MATKPFVSNLYEVVSMDINYFFQYGHEKLYTANHKRPHQDYNGFENTELIYTKNDNIQVPLSIARINVPFHTGTNLRTGKNGHFIRSMLSKKHLESEDYPNFFDVA